MKKLLSILLACAMIFVFVAACADDSAPAADPTPAPTPAPETETDPEPEPEPTPEPDDDPFDGVELEDLRIALVAHGPESIQFDGSFNEGSWDGIHAFLEARSLRSDQANFFQAHAADDEARVDVMLDAIEWGANILVLPGFHFASSVYTAANLFPDTKFVLLDTLTNPGPTPPNVATILYAEEQSGFLAGYAAVMEGYRTLGFMGGIAVPSVVRFGHGFIEGAEYAAQSLGLDAGDVTINYHYIGSFVPSPEVATMAGAWFAGGIEAIFAAAGGAGFSVISAAEDANAWVIGVDVDQSVVSDAVLTSAMKALAVSVNDMLTDFVSGYFRGGSDILFDATINGVALPMESSRFSNFTPAQYDAILAQLAAGSIVVSTAVPGEGDSTDPNEHLTIDLVTATFIP